ncbi:type IV pilus assembly protein PilM [Thermosyntropha sp.]|uniref:type IV pilus biogenesis protein PilM n=1 Tax=Thermosyntropha sp. TaxID=2740820 RepID=UPI0025F067FD|nr:type IV pilus assembly protein PilM [Thermosyntropha sp.]MBO8159234.1 type IV pilus assembly protein PilM [Thermosyntropha sp.]
MFRSKVGVGLDIGTEKIKMVKVTRRGNNHEILGYDSIFTPSGTVELGNILEPEKLGIELARLKEKMGIKKEKVIAAASGPQVYTRILSMPQMPREELKEAAIFQASTFLPISIDEAVIDVFPLRDIEDETGKKTEIFFVAVRKNQIEKLDLACQIAGLNLAVIDIEPLALQRVIAGERENRAFLNIGASRAYFSVFNDGSLVMHRSLSFGCSAFAMSAGEACSGYEFLESVDLRSGNYEYFINDMINELNRAVEYYKMQFKNTLNHIVLCGGGSRMPGIDEILMEKTGIKFELAGISPNILIPPDLEEKDKKELVYEFLIALGLAVRGVV